MADPSVADTNPPKPDLDSGPLAIPSLDPVFFFSDPTVFSNLGDLDSFPDRIDLDFNFNFNFDDLHLPSDTDPIDPPASDPLQTSTDPGPDVSAILNSDGFDQISGYRSSSGACVLNSPSQGPRFSDVAKVLNVSSLETSQESGNKGSDVVRVLNCPSPESQSHNRKVSGPASSRGFGNSGTAVSEDPGNFARSAASSSNFANNSTNGNVDQKIKLDEEGNNCLLKRKKESEDVNSESRTSKYQRKNAGDKANPPYGLNATSGEEEKEKARLMRNRESAQLSRLRKKHYVEDLEDQVRSMHSTIQELNAKNSYLMAENVSLRQKLSGGAMGPDPHPSLAPMGSPLMPCPPYVVKPQGSQVPLVPIPKPHQSVPAPKAKKVESKTKKVASVSFLGLLFFILLFGGLVPMVNVKFGGVQDRVPGGSDYLGNRFYEHNRGRVLTVNGYLNGPDQNIGMGSSNGRLGAQINFSIIFLEDAFMGYAILVRIFYCGLTLLWFTTTVVVHILCCGLALLKLWFTTTVVVHILCCGLILLWFTSHPLPWFYLVIAVVHHRNYVRSHPFYYGLVLLWFIVWFCGIVLLWFTRFPGIVLLWFCGFVLPWFRDKYCLAYNTYHEITSQDPL